MPFSRCDRDLDIIAALHDDPNITDALSANQLKAKFDQGPKELKEWINDALLPALEAVNAATKLGATLGDDATVITVQQAINKVKEIAEQAQQGSIADNSIEAVKLKNVDANGANGAVSTTKINDGAVTHAKLAANAVETDNIKDGAVTSDKLASSAFSGTAITNNSITGEKLTANSVSTSYTGELTVAGWTGSAAPYTQSVTVTGVLAADEPMVDLIPSDTYSTAALEDSQWGQIYKAVATANTITFYAKAKPSVALNFKARCIRK